MSNTLASSQMDFWTPPKAFIHIIDNERGEWPDVNRSNSIRHAHSRVYVSIESFMESGQLNGRAVVLDLKLKKSCALEALEQLISMCNLPVVYVADRDDLDSAVSAMRIGAVDVLVRPYSLIEAIQLCKLVINKRNGRKRLSATATAAAGRLKDLTPRQREVLQGIAAGLTNKAIARRLALSPRTVEMHRARMFDRLCISSTLDAVRLAQDAGLAGFRTHGESL